MTIRCWGISRVDVLIMAKVLWGYSSFSSVFVGSFTQFVNLEDDDMQFAVNRFRNISFTFTKMTGMFLACTDEIKIALESTVVTVLVAAFTRSFLSFMHD